MLGNSMLQTLISIHQVTFQRHTSRSRYPMAGRLMRPRRIHSRKNEERECGSSRKRRRGGETYSSILEYKTPFFYSYFLLVILVQGKKQRHLMTKRLRNVQPHTLSYSVSLSLRCKMLLSFGSGSSH